MNKEQLERYRTDFSQTLLENFVPFWEKFSPDFEYGGYLCGFDRDGELFYTDKSVWQQGRSLWMFSKLYNEFGHKESWLKCAKLGYDFINRYCFDPQEHMYFRVTRDGKPLVLRRYYFSEAFAIMGYAQYYLATGDPKVKQKALHVYSLMLRYFSTPGYFPPKVNPHTRSMQGHSILMIMMNVSQCMREIDDNPCYQLMIDQCIEKLLTQFVREDKHALCESISSDGAFVDSPEGRLMNPGHSIETAWFMMDEAILRKDATLMKKAMQILRWSLERGWDQEQEGIFYFVDLDGKPPLSLEWDMKLLWPHCEAMIALILSYRYTKDAYYSEWFDRIAEYVFSHFADPGHPEWLGHLHRDGTPISYIKGSDWKGPYHNVRAFMILSQQFEALRQDIPLIF